MSSGSLWGRRSGWAKTLLMLAPLLVLQIVLLAETSALVHRWNAWRHIPEGEGWGGFGIALWELLLGAANVLALLVACVGWLIAGLVGKKKDAERIND